MSFRRLGTFVVSLLIAAAAHAGVGILMRPVEAASAKPAPIRAPIGALSATSFEGFVRCPAELGDQCTNPFGSIFMDSNTAYYRDVIVGAYTFVSGVTDGENWSALFTDVFAEPLNPSHPTSDRGLVVEVKNRNGHVDVVEVRGGELKLRCRAFAKPPTRESDCRNTRPSRRA